MGKLKERWEFIIGYVVLVISLSAFKDELNEINLDIGIFNFTASQFLFTLILSFLFALHLYLIPFLFSSTKYANWKIFSFLESSSYSLFIFIAISPIFVLSATGIISLYNSFRKIPPNAYEIKDGIERAVSILIATISSIISIRIAIFYRRNKYLNQKSELELLEIAEFENTQKLFNEGFYSQSILEAFKVLELHLKRLIAQKSIPFRSNKFQDIISFVQKLELISKDDIALINQIKQMRNSVAHLDVDFTKEQATKAINFIKELINKTSKY